MNPTFPTFPPFPTSHYENRCYHNNYGKTFNNSGIISNSNFGIIYESGNPMASKKYISDNDNDAEEDYNKKNIKAMEHLLFNQ